MYSTTILTRVKQLFSRVSVDDDDRTLVISSSRGAKTTPLPKAILRKYTILRSLGKGAFGIVYLAEDRMIGRFVAIKQLFKSHMRVVETHERFMQEARISAQLDHPNVINVFSLEEDKHSACIIMEYLGGGSLHAYMMKRGVLDQESALRIFRGVVKGLAAAHAMKVVHRDIKPQNIIFDHLGIPKISDFGVAYLPASAGGSPDIENDDEGIVGTPRYMSPEQISGDRMDCRTDLYSAGVVLYEMLQGEPVFKIPPNSDLATIAGIINTVPPAEMNNRVHPVLRDMTLKLLSKSPRDRFLNAKEVLTRIEEIGNVLAVQKDFNQTSNALRNIDGFAKSALTTAEFADVIRLLLIDGIISPPERREISLRAEILGIGDSLAKEIEDEVRSQNGAPSLLALEKYSKMLYDCFKSSDSLEISSSARKQLETIRKELCISSIEAEMLECQSLENVQREQDNQ